MPDWSQIKKSAKYKRSLVYLSGNNQTVNKKFTCELKTDGSRFSIIVFDLPISVKQYNEICSGDLNKITNIYFVDHKDIVRRSVQYHGNTLGYILIGSLTDKIYALNRCVAIARMYRIFRLLGCFMLFLEYQFCTFKRTDYEKYTGKCLILALTVLPLSAQEAGSSTGGSGGAASIWRCSRWRS